ncbi:MAG: hypothetical protein GY805_38230 [Chloroflexi bacterium]|nr:hypothetical protein [Chloroflexota bacterium]
MYVSSKTGGQLFEIDQQILMCGEGILRASCGDGKVKKRMVGGERPFAINSSIFYTVVQTV